MSKANLIGAAAGVVAAAVGVAAFVSDRREAPVEEPAAESIPQSPPQPNSQPTYQVGAGANAVIGSPGAVVNSNVTINEHDRAAEKRADVRTSLLLGHDACMQDVEYFQRLPDINFAGIVPTRLEQYVDPRDLYEVVGEETYNELSLFVQNTIYPLMMSLQVSSVNASLATAFQQQAAAGEDELSREMSRRMADSISSADRDESMREALRQMGGLMGGSAMTALDSDESPRDAFISATEQFCKRMQAVGQSIER